MIKFAKNLISKSLNQYPYHFLVLRVSRFYFKNYKFIPKTDEVVDIVLLTLDRLEDTKRTIKSLYKTTVKFNLIVIDNNSSKEMKDYLNLISKKYNNIQLFFSEKNLGVSGGRQMALEYCKSKYIAFIDNDMRFIPGYFENLLKSLEQNSSVAACVGKIINPTTYIEKLTPKFLEESDVVKFFDPDQGKKFNDKSTLESNSTDWVPGVAMWRAQALKKYKYDTEILGAYEDNELCFRMRKEYRFINSPEAICVHVSANFSPPTKNEVNYNKDRFGKERLINACKRFYKVHKKYFAYVANKDQDISEHAKYLGFKNLEEYKNAMKD